MEKEPNVKEEAVSQEEQETAELNLEQLDEIAGGGLGSIIGAQHIHGSY